MWGHSSRDVHQTGGQYLTPRREGKAEGQASGSIVTGLSMGYKVLERGEMAKTDS